MSADNKIKYLRELNGLTQDQLADEIGVSKWTISKLETGTRSIHGVSLDTIEKMVKALHVAEPKDLYRSRWNHMQRIRGLDNITSNAQLCGISWAIMDYLTWGPHRRGGKLSLTVLDKANASQTVEEITNRMISKFQTETRGKFDKCNQWCEVMDKLDVDAKTPQGPAGSAGAEYIAYYKAGADLYGISNDETL